MPQINPNTKTMKLLAYPLTLIAAILLASCNAKIDRHALVSRHNPRITAVDSLSSLSVGNGNFAFTVDITGLQTFPEQYSQGVPLGTQSVWGWHSFPNDSNYVIEDVLRPYNLKRGRDETYPVGRRGQGRHSDAVDYLRANMHRMHLGTIGLELTDSAGNPTPTDSITAIDQRLDMWKGVIKSSFSVSGIPVEVSTLSHPERDMVAGEVVSDLIPTGKLALRLRFPYPTGQHTDDACDWEKLNRHSSRIIRKDDRQLIIERTLDTTKYYVNVCWEGGMDVNEKEPHYFVLTPSGKDAKFTVEFTPTMPDSVTPSFDASLAATERHWKNFWQSGGAVDLSGSTDPRADELERRIVLSQYLTAIQCSGNEPPQETGLTYNSWHGKFHLEMHWWHAVHFALWGRPELLERSMPWYTEAAPAAKATAERQGFDGVRWMKMTDPTGEESPSDIGPFLVWQQPHYIYMAELLYRQNPSEETITKYKNLVFETADFMASFVSYDSLNNRYILKGLIPAQEMMRPEETVNPPFELSYWHYGLSVAQQWRERSGLARNQKWDDIIDKLSVLAQKDGLYLTAESAPQTYHDRRFTSDHMAVLGAYGILPGNRLFESETMSNTLDWIWDNWNWGHTWGWDFPMVAMCAARLGEPDKAVDALLMDKRTNTYLPNGHNYQNNTLRIYLPGNGGLLSAVAMMCAGWDGQDTDAPGFPKDGKWKVKWEGLRPMP